MHYRPPPIPSMAAAHGSRLRIPLHGLPAALLVLVIGWSLADGPTPAWAGASGDPVDTRLIDREAAGGLESEGTQVQGHITLPAGARLLADQAYGSDPAQRYDVYLPARAQADAPVIFMVHGGAWRIGDKAMSRVVQNKISHWLPQGVIVVSINYRMLPESAPAEQAQDVAAALAHAQGAAAHWGGNASKFVLMGHSAGAHLIALLSADPSVPLRAGARPWLGSVVLDSAALDVVALMERRHARLYDRAFGSDAQAWQAVSPMQHLTGDTAPMLLVCSTERPDKPCAEARLFARKVETLGGSAAVLPQARTHAAINADLGMPGDYTRAVDVFLTRLDAGFMPDLGR